MRSNTAFVLATLAVGQVSAGALKHASFHARRHILARENAEIDIGKRAPIEYDLSDVDWTKALENINWSTVNYGGSSSSAAPPPASSSVAPASVAPTSVAPASSAVAYTSAVSVAVAESTPTPTSAAAYTPSPTPSSSAVASTTQASNSVTGAILEAADEAKLLALGFISAGLNALSGDACVGSSNPYVAELSNESGEDLIFVCWEGATSWVNTHAPALTVSVPSGGSTSISFSDSFSGACSAVYSDTQLVNGQVSNSWFEATFGAYGTYDISREVNMSGHSISAVGPKCTADMNTCVFTCDSGNSCMTGYTLQNCDASNGGGSGTYGGAASGGCNGLGSSATIKVTLS